MADFAPSKAQVQVVQDRLRQIRTHLPAATNKVFQPHVLNSLIKTIHTDSDLCAQLHKITQRTYQNNARRAQALAAAALAHGFELLKQRSASAAPRDHGKASEDLDSTSTSPGQTFFEPGKGR